MTNSSTILIALAPVLVWRMVARFRRQVGRQRSSGVRHKIHACLYSGLVVAVAAMVWPHMEALECLLLGAVAGGLLAQYGLRITLFEPTRQGLFYTPKAWLGITLSLLFVARIAYRIAQLLLLDPTAHAPPPALMQSPATLAIFGLLAGYNTAYAVGLLLWRRGVIRRAREREQGS